MGTNSRDIGPFALAVAAELRAAIARAGHSQRAFATLSGMPLSTLSKTLGGTRVADVEDIFLIATALNLDPREILEGAEKAIRREAKRAEATSNGGGTLRALAKQQKTSTKTRKDGHATTSVER